MSNKLLMVAAVSLGILACPTAFTPSHPPCDEDADCSAEVLGSDFAGYVCAGGQCWAEAEAPTPDAGSDPLGGLYDAGPSADTGSEPECREDADCEADHICSNRVCVPYQSGCQSDDQCPDGEVCRDSDCLIACEGHSGCAPNRACFDGACIEFAACGGEGDPACPGDLRCLEDRCARPECYPGQDCADGMVCVEGVCEAA